MSYLARILPWSAQPAPAPPSGLTPARKLWGIVAGAWQRVLDAREGRGPGRRLRVVEKVALGDKQFVAVLELDGATYLAGGGPGVPLSLIPAQSMGSGKQTTRLGADLKLQPTRAVYAVNKKVRRTHTKTTLSAQESAFSRRVSRTAMGVSPHPSGEFTGKDQTQGETELGAMALSKGETKTSAAPDIYAHRAASLLNEAITKAAVLPTEAFAQPAQVIGKVPEALPSTQLPTTLPESRIAVPGADFPMRLNKTLLEQDAPEVAPSASTAFAALLDLRMLASKVFEELDTNPELGNGAAAPAQAAAAKPEALPAAVHEVKQPSRVLNRLHRIRGRLSAYACFLVLFLLPHGIGHAQTLPLFSVSAHHAVSIARGPSLELGVAGASLLAEAPLPSGDIHITGLGGSSASWSIVVLLTLLTLIPALLLCITPFARLLIVFHFLRQALGLQTTPSNQTLIGLSLILTFFLMQPTGEVIYRDAIVPAQAGKLTPLDAVLRAGDPMRHFMAHYVREKDAELFLEIAKEPRPRTVEDMSFRVLLPSYILSELKAGFQIGTVLFLPFLIVDMVVASITTSVGMMQLPPVVISTPLKLLLFLMVDGWHLLIGSLMRSFN